MRLPAFFLLLFISVQSSSQILNKIRNKAVGKAKTEIDDTKYEARQKAREKVSDQLNEMSASYDSSEVDYAILLSDNAGLLAGKSQNEFSAKFLRMARAARSLYREKDLSDEDNARLNLQFGQSAYAAGKYVYAENRLENAMDYFERAGLSADMGYLKTIATRGLLYTSMGRFSLATIYTEKALSLRIEKLGENHQAVAASLNNLAVLHYSLGQYNEAEKEIADCISILQKNHEGAALSYITVLNNRAILYQSMGRFDEGLRSLKEALSVLDQLEKPAPRLHQRIYSNLALLHQLMGNFADAELIYAALEKKINKGSSEEANLLNNRAVLYMLMKKQDKVEAQLKASAEIYKKSLGENSPAYARVISDLGNFFRFSNRLEEASPLLEKAFSIRRDALGELHPLFAQSEEDLAILYWKQGKKAEAKVYYERVMARSLDFIEKYFPPMSEAEKTKYWDLLSPRFERYYHFALENAATDPDGLSRIMDYRIATKGLLLNSSRKLSRAILESGNESLINDYAAWLDNKEQLTVLYGYSREDLREQGISLDSLQAVTNNMERSLSERSTAFSGIVFSTRKTIDDLLLKLKEGEALVEMIRLRGWDQTFSDSCYYAALIIAPGHSAQLVLLKNGYDLENKYARQYRLSMKNRVMDEKSYDYYWAPIAKELGPKKKIYFSADGVYTQLNPYTFKKSGADYLLNSSEIVLLGNPADLLDLDKKESYSKKALLFGYPDYGAGNISQLPGTRVEVDAIQKLLKGAGFEVSEYIQKEASEHNLKSTHAISILHIATHGYFLKDVSKPAWPIGVLADYAKENVLLRSGLMLAGASEKDRSSAALDSSNNGILTSYEAMNLDLRGTDLVVLSACETGLGEVKAGEGVYGLQRAFMAAGADAIIMSLWKVDDAATQLLMNLFYNNWVKTKDRQQAFRLAQQQLMLKYKEPLYWGGFVMISR